MAKLSLFDRRRRRVRTTLKARAGGRPRLSVHRSGRHIYAQIIDDAQGLTIAAASSLTKGSKGIGANVDAAVKVGKEIAEKAKAAGIDINVIKEPDDGYWDNVWLKKPFVASYWSGRPTVDWMMTTAYAADAAWNDTFWKNPRFNELLVAARSETDEAKRAAMYAEMQQILHDEGGVITVAFVSWRLAMTQNIGHGETGGILPADNHRCAERWWRTDV